MEGKNLDKVGRILDKVGRILLYRRFIVLDLDVTETVAVILKVFAVERVVKIRKVKKKSCLS